MPLSSIRIAMLSLLRKCGAKTASLEVKLVVMRMLDKGMTQKAVADTLGYNPVTIWKWRQA